MGRVNVSQLSAGMVLAADVRTDRGQVLARGGASLSDRHLKAFKAWGVTEVQIEGEADIAAPAPDIDDATRAEIEAGLAQRFVLAGTKSPVMNELHRLALARALKEAAG